MIRIHNRIWIRNPAGGDMISRQIPRHDFNSDVVKVFRGRTFTFLQGCGSGSVVQNLVGSGSVLNTKVLNLFKLSAVFIDQSDV